MQPSRGHRRRMPRAWLACSTAIVLAHGSNAAATWPQDTPASWSLTKLTGANGALFQSTLAAEKAGQSVAFGDFNGDGKADLLIGTWNDTGAGNVYVVYGRATVPTAARSLDSMAAAVGVTISGAAATSSAGLSVTASDVNGDGFSDMIIGAPGTANGAQAAAGAVYVVYGSSTLGAAISLPPAAGKGFTIHGAAAFDEAGSSVAGGFDFNKDGNEDILIGAPMADPRDVQSGAAYVVYGAAAASANLQLSAPGTRGFVVKGAAAGEYTGHSVASAGDFNKDGFPDLIVGAHKATVVNNFSGKAYVVFGGATVGASGAIDLRNVPGNSTIGLQLSGVDANSFCGSSVAGGFDFNGDGISDVVVGAPGAAGPAGLKAGKAYVIFGSATYGTTSAPDVTLSSLTADGKGFTIDGPAAGAATGTAVASAGDLQNDALGDVLVGSSGTGATSPGYVTVVYGASQARSKDLSLSALTAAEGVTFVGETVGLRFGAALAGSGDSNGDGLPDIAAGATGYNGSRGQVALILPAVALIKPVEGATPAPTPAATPAVTAAPTPTPTAAPTVEGCTNVGSACGTSMPSFTACCAGACQGGVCVAPTLAPTPSAALLLPQPVSAPAGSAQVTAFSSLQSGRFAQAAAQGGVISIAIGSDFSAAAGVSLAVQTVSEVGADGVVLTSSSSGSSRAVAVAALSFTPGGVDWVRVSGVLALTTTLTAELAVDAAAAAAGGAAEEEEETAAAVAQLAVTAYLFQEEGEVLLAGGRETAQVQPGTLKVSISVTDWPWCAAGSCSSAGAFLRLNLSAAAPAALEAVTAASAAGLEYTGATPEAAVSVLMSQWAYGDDYGWESAVVSSEAPGTLTVLLPRSTGVLYYDPLVALSGSGVASEPDPPVAAQSVAALSEDEALSVTSTMSFLAGVLFAIAVGCWCCKCTRRSSVGTDSSCEDAAAGDESGLAIVPADNGNSSSSNGGVASSGKRFRHWVAKSSSRATTPAAATPPASPDRSGPAQQKSGVLTRARAKVAFFGGKKPVRQDPELGVKEEWTGPNIASDPTAAPDWIKSLQQGNAAPSPSSGYAAAATASTTATAAAADSSSSNGAGGGGGGLDWLAAAATAPALPVRPQTAVSSGYGSSGASQSWMNPVHSGAAAGAAGGGSNWLANAAGSIAQQSASSEARPATAIGGYSTGGYPSNGYPSTGGTRWGV